MRIDIKPMSVNKAWGGRTFKSNDYKKYITDLMKILPHQEIPTGELEIYLKWGFSSKASDFDNPIKPFVDILQKRYGFNDKMIKRAIIDVDHVKRGEEYIVFEIKQLGEG
jgi:Holliday junction resolvase RusA-like endonuclease